MSSIENVRLRRFFRRQLVPRARKLRERGVRLFPLGPEDHAATWYVDYPPGEPELVDTTDDLLGSLEAPWADEGLHELSGLSAALRELQDKIRVTEAESTEVSPFIYVMY